MITFSKFSNLGMVFKEKTMANAVSADSGKFFSPWQQPVNRWTEQPHSIHNDAVATKIGMRGGTIPGIVHLNHFVPIIQET